MDNTAYTYDSSQTGTLQPDMYRVLAQDGFEFSSLDVDIADAITNLERHVSSGNFALALIQRRETGHMHWVVVAGVQDRQLLICDSLKSQPYLEEPENWWKECVLGIVLLKPASARNRIPVWKLHWTGTLDMREAFHRMRTEKLHPGPKKT